MAGKRERNFPHITRRQRLVLGVFVSFVTLSIVAGSLPTVESFPPSEVPDRFALGIPQLRHTPAPSTPAPSLVPPGLPFGGEFPPRPPVEALTGAPAPTVSPRSTPRPVRVRRAPQPVLPPRGAPRVYGRASWYCLRNVSVCVKGFPGGFFAAAGPRLRVAMGGGTSAIAPQPWRGKRVTVCVTDTTNCVRVILIDWCQCSWKKPGEKIIDLYGDAMRALASDFQSRGVLRVTVYTR